MKIYAHGTDPQTDLLMVQWWLRMREDGDLEKTFLQSALTLSGFMSVWRADTGLMLEIDEEGITVAGWIQRFMGAGMFGLWVRADKRKNIGTLRAVLNMYRAVFGAGLTSIVGITKQPELLEEHERLGYKILGSVPYLWDKENDGYVVVLTAADFYERWGRSDDDAAAPLEAFMLSSQPAGAVH